MILKMLVCKHNMEVTFSMEKQNFVHNDQVMPLPGKKKKKKKDIYAVFSLLEPYTQGKESDD